MLNRKENEPLLSAVNTNETPKNELIEAIQADINREKKKAEHDEHILRDYAPAYSLGYMAGGEVVIGVATASLADFLYLSSAFVLGTAPVFAGAAGAVYGASYYHRTQEKRHIVERLTREINATTNLDAFFAKAQEICQTHAPYLRKERGTYSYTLVQNFVGNKYGHETGNTKSWIDITRAMENRCRALASVGEVDAALRKLDEMTSQTSTAPPPTPRPR
jgi:hypothetical protein